MKIPSPFKDEPNYTQEGEVSMEKAPYPLAEHTLHP